MDDKQAGQVAIRRKKSPTPEPEIIEHDPRGDLILNVGTQRSNETLSKTFRVCSRTLARCSPVFERMLYGAMAESNRKTCGEWTVALPEDDPVAFATWSKICHGRLDEVSSFLTVDELFHLTSLTHYYDTTRMLASWKSKWATSLSIPRDEIGLHKFLWISIELGETHLAASTARTIIMESTGDLAEEAIQQELSSVPMSDLITRLHAIRPQTISAMLKLFKQLSDILIVEDEKPRWCRHASYMGPHRCESMILGSIVWCLTRAGLWPIPPAEEVKYSVLGLFQKLTGIVVHDIGQAEKRGEDHTSCNPRQFLVERLQRILAEIPDPLKDIESRGD